MITLRDVEHIARLARLRLTDEEKGTYMEQLNNILEYMGKLNQLDTSDVKPTYHVLPKKNAFRPDEVKDSIEHNLALENSAERDEEFFIVPPVIEE